jgi:membrane protein implicated in regulation of membrane protease activity
LIFQGAPQRTIFHTWIGTKIALAAGEEPVVEWLRESQWLWWVGAALVLGLVEVTSLDLVFMMLSAGALAAAGSALAGGSFTVQVLVFAATSALLLAVVRPVALRRLKPAGPAQLTGTAAHVGRPAVVLLPVTDRAGRVKLAGEEWSARSAVPGRTFGVDELVQVVQIDGATAVVGPSRTASGPVPEGQEAP